MAGNELSYKSSKNVLQTPLSAGATYTGTWEQVDNFEKITFACYSSSDATIYADLP